MSNEKTVKFKEGLISAILFVVVVLASHGVYTSMM